MCMRCRSLRYLIMLFFGLCFALLGCKHTANSDLRSDISAPRWSLGQTVRTPDRVTYLFSWTNESKFKDAPLAALDSKLAAARTRNASGNSVDYRSAKAGAGIYGAADPFVSKSFGKYLLILPVAANQQFTALGGGIDSEQYGEIVQSAEAGVVYPWEAYIKDDLNQPLAYAAVIRDSEILDLKNIKVFGPIEPDYSCRHIQRISPLFENWIDALASIPPDFYFCTLPIIARYIDLDLSNAKKRDGDDSLDLVPLLFAAQIRSGSFLAQSAGVKDEAVTCVGAPYCTLKFGRFVSRLIFTQWRIQDEYDSGQDQLSLDEAVRVAKAYQLLNESDQITDAAFFIKILAERLQALRQDFDQNLRSHLMFYDDIINKIKPDSMVVWH